MSDVTEKVAHIMRLWRLGYFGVCHEGLTDVRALRALDLVAPVPALPVERAAGTEK